MLSNYVIFLIVVILIISAIGVNTYEGYKDFNQYQDIFKFDYDYQLDPIQFTDKCGGLGLIDEYSEGQNGKSDAYKDRYIPYVLNFGFNELNRDY